MFYYVKEKLNYFLITNVLFFFRMLDFETILKIGLNFCRTDLEQRLELSRQNQKRMQDEMSNWHAELQNYRKMVSIC